MLHLLDPRSRVHVPPAIITPPYTVLRTRDVFQLTAPDSAGNYAVALIGEHTNTAATQRPCVTQFLAIHGTSGNIPGVTESAVLCGDVNAIGSGRAHLRLHSLTVMVQADAAPTAARGLGYMGAMPGNINRGAFATWNAVATNIIARVQARQFTAYKSIGESPPTCTSYPMDVTQWSTFDTLQQFGGLLENHMTDSLAPIAIVLAGNPAGAVTYNVTICAEWRVIFTLVDQRSSLHERHPPTNSTIIASAQAFAADQAGDLSGSTVPSLSGMLPIATGAAGLGLSMAAMAGPVGRQELRRRMRQLSLR